MIPGLLIAAPASGGGKTTLTLGLLRALRRLGRAPVSGKVGPDYIDPAFHAAASGAPCYTLDPWAMDAGRLASLLDRQAARGRVLVVEGVMGLFDGAPAAGVAGDGSTARLAALSGLPVVLVVDASGQAASAAAVVRGFATHRPDVTVAAVVFTKVGPGRHADILRAAMAESLPHIPVLGCLPRLPGLGLPSRHLGLVQALEHPDLEAFLETAADAVAAHLDLDALLALARPPRLTPAAAPIPPLVPPLGQRIAVARDAAYAFAYPALLEDWRAAGAAVLPFSPLADEAPAADADAVYLPGGYPELHAGRLAGGTAFLPGLRAAAERGAVVFGECGGYMTLGETLEDADGVVHPMAGLLPLATSFARRKLHLGYRTAALCADGPLGPAGGGFRAHEFHYAVVLGEDHSRAEPLFETKDATGSLTSSQGLRRGPVMGSFLHLIASDPAPVPA
ncbi:cobyrinate a,c-diamide synthase [Caenispirillum bisanense]|uniref:Cobyrinate a,c-diamide synthase n=1 Tax=Caenispirillum bisanense TaxID=414052 RepID=A0A286GAF6_9PROT|nr:cobyrinate a,c-diamide synthase [Caenispirillum bisanense]SOD92470.1 hydrogenobyrinic acid a,c-diamide synthase (glutamine-hydrolysing) /cobyrinate a,c-diamide synthase [Caenispirillum bisanense]